MTPQFKSLLLLEDDFGIPYMLHEDLIYDSAVLNRTVTVCQGFKTDLASIPRLLWNVLPKSGKYDKAAVVHDWLYQKGCDSRALADATLDEAMVVLGVGRMLRWTIYSGVRIGGWKSWGEYRAADATHTQQPLVAEAQVKTMAKRAAGGSA